MAKCITKIWKYFSWSIKYSVTNKSLRGRDSFKGIAMSNKIEIYCVNTKMTFTTYTNTEIRKIIDLISFIFKIVCYIGDKI